MERDRAFLLDILQSARLAARYVLVEVLTPPLAPPNAAAQPPTDGPRL